jgi:hypothetical protein
MTTRLMMWKGAPKLLYAVTEQLAPWGNRARAFESVMVIRTT